VAISTFKLYKKLSNELKFKYSELDYVEQACIEGNMEFEEHYRNFCGEHNISISELESNNPEKVKQFSNKPVTPDQQEKDISVEPSKEDKRRKKIFQRIFHGIAKKIHPDKFSNMEKTNEILDKEEMFKRATQALDNEKWGELLEIAEKLDIHPQKYEKINELLRDEISDLNKEIARKQRSFGWMMSQAETVEEKDNIVISFLKNLFNYTFNP
tara:strand:+ start:1062 stop:1700 length:639 start_codon:yes stop_codon:yes gene_type:complete